MRTAGSFVPIFADDLSACRGAPELVGLVAVLARATAARCAGAVDPWSGAREYVLKATGLSARTMQRHLEELERRGFVILRGSDGRLLGITSASLDRFYRANFDGPVPGASPVTPVPRSVGGSTRGTGATGDARGASPVAPLVLIQTARVGLQSGRKGNNPSSEAGGVTGDARPPEAEGETGQPADPDPTADAEPTPEKLAERRARLEALGLVRPGAFRGRAGGAASSA